MEMHYANCCGAEKKLQISKRLGFDDILFKKKIVPFALDGYEIGHSQLSATRLFGYLLPHIQCALMK